MYIYNWTYVCKESVKVLHQYLYKLKIHLNTNASPALSVYLKLGIAYVLSGDASPSDSSRHYLKNHALFLIFFSFLLFFFSFYSFLKFLKWCYSTKKKLRLKYYRNSIDFQQRSIVVVCINLNIRSPHA